MAAQKKAPKLNNLILKLIDKSHLAFIKKKDFIILIMGRNKEKDKNKKKIGFKYLYCGKIQYKKINCFYKHPEKILSS